MSSQGRLAVISGPSGSGKTTICRALLEDERVVLSVSATTRKKRPMETEGVDYFFLSPEDFAQRVERGEFLEWAEYNGNRYGTLRSEVGRKLGQGKTVILEIEVQGTRKLRDAGIEASFVFIMPPGLEELERRLRARKTEDEETIQRRLAIASEEMNMAHLYDHVVINRELDRAVRELRIYLGLESGELETQGSGEDD
ncbi:MAG: guanylate kinase [Planctomycetota bacterium]|nr:MAG: guanylate kinase [Planctomycetota bacterium]